MKYSIINNKIIKTICFSLIMVVFSQIWLKPVVSLAGFKTGENRPSENFLSFIPIITKTCAYCYYIDSNGGSDTNTGNSENKPWRTLAPLNQTNLLPGSVIHFKRGSSWTGGLEIRASGAPGKPITFTTYGTGNRPVFTNPGNGTSWSSAIMIFANWVVVDGLLTKDAHDAGVYIAKGSDYNTVRDIESTNVGIGISVLGQHNLVTLNYLHDLRMINNTPGGDDDYGAVGIWLGNSNNEISYNRMVNCIAPSYDYGTDGGAIEFYGFADNNYIHHNWANGNKGFLEVGGGSAKDSVVAYNVSVNNGRFSIIHLSDKYKSVVQNFRVENNTIVETANTGLGWVILGFGGDPNPNTFLLRNNIFYIEMFQAITNKSSFTHDHNLFYMGSGTVPGFTLGQTETSSDPLFKDLMNGDYHLGPNSPAINRGVDIGFTLDFDNHPVFSGSAPDLGAFEYP